MLVQPYSPVEGKGKAILMEQKEDSSDDYAPSLLVRANAPAHVQVMSQKIPQGLKKRIDDSSGQTPSPKKSRDNEAPSKEKVLVGEVIDLSEVVPTVDPPFQNVSKSKSSKGGISDGSRQTKTSSTTVVLSMEAKKGKDMLLYYLHRSLPEVSDQLSGADNELSLELVMGGVLKEAARADAGKKEVEDVRNELGEVNKRLLTANKRVEELTKETQEMPSTAQLEADNDALSKEVNELKDETDCLHTLLSKLEGRTSRLGRLGRRSSRKSQAAKENLEATTSTLLTDQSTKTPAAQNVEPLAPTDQADPDKEPGTPAV
uniref:Uncharacterized protein n=1 Tax=Cannabis sativa TaxID=3483 RepID=A0A803QH60_CANSA